MKAREKETRGSSFREKTAISRFSALRLSTLLCQFELAPFLLYPSPRRLPIFTVREVYGILLARPNFPSTFQSSALAFDISFSLVPSFLPFFFPSLSYFDLNETICDRSTMPLLIVSRFREKPTSTYPVDKSCETSESVIMYGLWIIRFVSFALMLLSIRKRGSTLELKRIYANLTRFLEAYYPNDVVWL